MIYGLKTFNLVEETGDEKTSGTIKVFYEAKQVDYLICSLKAKNRCLEKKYNIVVLSKNESVAKQVEGNAEYWKKLCEKRTQMFLEEQAARAAVAEQLQKEIHKPFTYIEKLQVMKIILFKRMAETAFYHYKYLDLLAKCHYANKEEKKILERKKRQWILFDKKVKELEKELEND